MGMTDRQFDSYQLRLLRDLERILADLKAMNVQNKDLETLVEDLKNELKRP
ncbi:MAG: hypothetical protein FWE21_04345 [Defluviitaleaceae bacterium]|nr:hypothetical protein [Defluviitaleaceae bacterium]